MFQNVSVRTVLTFHLPASLQMMASFALLLVMGFRLLSWYPMQNITASSGCVLEHSLGTEKALEQNSEMLLHPSLSLQKAVDGVGSKQLKILRVQEFLWLNNWADKGTDVALRWVQRLLGLKAGIWDSNALPCQSPWLHQTWAEY